MHPLECYQYWENLIVAGEDTTMLVQMNYVCTYPAPDWPRGHWNKRQNIARTENSESAKIDVTYTQHTCVYI